ncbi:BZ3500_MvSof-1268-A1-R1_Chr1-2g01423 [Microbotryum saponariae]|uniref:BZ3500_MvSof-1268-A1-R1_Chr1-2g01423 protein n=1 Tax=Microbotryum saponariae TaxID=289078 RepID=A0A2X0MBD8_9BASI|nr:BZ3500_MvSof-1268-A1-R1_Chr1-2g01423 [Microbotryum saponariae]SCZ97393.1 BZ3501_MvSof-1269-A2-R1_Chr1-2g01022 [Microbotryum saponariae]
MTTSTSSSSTASSSSARPIPSITIHGPTARGGHLDSLVGGGGSNGRLRTRSPKGQRGRPRKAVVTGMSAPPIQTSEEETGKGKGKSKRRWVGLRTGKGVVVVVTVVIVVAVVGLLISAIRIISRDPIEEAPPLLRTRHSPLLPRRRVRDPSHYKRHTQAARGTGAVPPSRNSKADPDETEKKDLTKAGGEGKAQQGVVIDEVVKDALADVWDLEKDVPPVEGSSSLPRNPKNVPIPTDETPSEGKTTTRSLKELYAELEGMGLSVDDLTQALDEAYRGGEAGAGK